jgi:hypothetical protein
MNSVDNENDITPTFKLLEDAIEGIQFKLAKLRVASHQSEPELAARIRECEDSILTEIVILKGIKGQL